MPLSDNRWLAGLLGGQNAIDSVDKKRASDKRREALSAAGLDPIYNELDGPLGLEHYRQTNKAEAAQRGRNASEEHEYNPSFFDLPRAGQSQVGREKEAQDDTRRLQDAVGDADLPDSLAEAPLAAFPSLVRAHENANAGGADAQLYEEQQARNQAADAASGHPIVSRYLRAIHKPEEAGKKIAGIAEIKQNHDLATTFLTQIGGLDENGEIDIDAGFKGIIEAGNRSDTRQFALGQEGQDVIQSLRNKGYASPSSISKLLLDQYAAVQEYQGLLESADRYEQTLPGPYAGRDSAGGQNAAVARGDTAGVEEQARGILEAPAEDVSREIDVSLRNAQPDVETAEPGGFIDRVKDFIGANDDGELSEVFNPGGKDEPGNLLDQVRGITPGENVDADYGIDFIKELGKAAVKGVKGVPDYFKGLGETLPTAIKATGAVLPIVPTAVKEGFEMMGVFGSERERASPELSKKFLQQGYIRKKLFDQLGELPEGGKARGAGRITGQVIPGLAEFPFGNIAESSELNARKHEELGIGHSADEAKWLSVLFGAAGLTGIFAPATGFGAKQGVKALAKNLLPVGGIGATAATAYTAPHEVAQGASPLEAIENSKDAMKLGFVLSAGGHTLANKTAKARQLRKLRKEFEEALKKQEASGGGTPPPGGEQPGGPPPADSEQTGGPPPRDEQEASSQGEEDGGSGSPFEEEPLGPKTEESSRVEQNGEDVGDIVFGEVRGADKPEVSRLTNIAKMELRIADDSSFANKMKLANWYAAAAQSRRVNPDDDSIFTIGGDDAIFHDMFNDAKGKSADELDQIANTLLEEFILQDPAEASRYIQGMREEANDLRDAPKEEPVSRASGAPVPPKKDTASDVFDEVPVDQQDAAPTQNLLDFDEVPVDTPSAPPRAADAEASGEVPVETPPSRTEGQKRAGEREGLQNKINSLERQLETWNDLSIKLKPEDKAYLEGLRAAVAKHKGELAALDGDRPASGEVPVVPSRPAAASPEAPPRADAEASGEVPVVPPRADDGGGQPVGGKDRLEKGDDGKLRTRYGLVKRDSGEWESVNVDEDGREIVSLTNNLDLSRNDEIQAARDTEWFDERIADVEKTLSNPNLNEQTRTIENQLLERLKRRRAEVAGESGEVPVASPSRAPEAPPRADAEASGEVPVVPPSRPEAEANKPWESRISDEDLQGQIDSLEGQLKSWRRITQGRKERPEEVEHLTPIRKLLKQLEDLQRERKTPPKKKSESKVETDKPAPDPVPEPEPAPKPEPEAKPEPAPKPDAKPEPDAKPTKKPRASKPKKEPAAEPKPTKKPRASKVNLGTIAEKKAQVDAYATRADFPASADRVLKWLGDKYKNKADFYAVVEYNMELLHDASLLAKNKYGDEHWALQLMNQSDELKDALTRLDEQKRRRIEEKAAKVERKAKYQREEKARRARPEEPTRRGEEGTDRWKGEGSGPPRAADQTTDALSSHARKGPGGYQRRLDAWREKTIARIVKAGENNNLEGLLDAAEGLLPERDYIGHLGRKSDDQYGAAFEAELDAIRAVQEKVDAEAERIRAERTPDQTRTSGESRQGREREADFFDANTPKGKKQDATNIVEVDAARKDLAKVLADVATGKKVSEVDFNGAIHDYLFALGGALTHRGWGTFQRLDPQRFKQETRGKYESVVRKAFEGDETSAKRDKAIADFQEEIHGKSVIDNAVADIMGLSRGDPRLAEYLLRRIGADEGRLKVLDAFIKEKKFEGFDKVRADALVQRTRLINEGVRKQIAFDKAEAALHDAEYPTDKKNFISRRGGNNRKNQSADKDPAINKQRDADFVFDELGRLFDEVGLGGLGFTFKFRTARQSDWTLGEDGVGSINAGSIDHTRGLVQLIYFGQSMGDMKWILNHEGGHALVKMMRPKEHKLMNLHGRKLWKKYDIKNRYSEHADSLNLTPEQRAALFNEEAFVEDFASYKEFGGKLDSPKALVRIYDRIANTLERAHNALRGAGFKTAEDLFRAMDSGELPKRPEADAIRKKIAANKEAAGWRFIEVEADYKARVATDTDGVKYYIGNKPNLTADGAQRAVDNSQRYLDKLFKIFAARQGLGPVVYHLATSDGRLKEVDSVPIGYGIVKILSRKREAVLDKNAILLPIEGSAWDNNRLRLWGLGEWIKVKADAPKHIGDTKMSYDAAWKTFILDPGRLLAEDVGAYKHMMDIIDNGVPRLKPYVKQLQKVMHELASEAPGLALGATFKSPLYNPRLVFDWGAPERVRRAMVKAAFDAYAPIHDILDVPLLIEGKPAFGLASADETRNTRRMYDAMAIDGPWRYVWDESGGTTRETIKGAKGIFEILDPMYESGLLDELFQFWQAHSSLELHGQGREKSLSLAQVQRAIALMEATPFRDTGQLKLNRVDAEGNPVEITTKAELFRSVMRDYYENFDTHFKEMMRTAGLVSEEQMATWGREYHIPFLRERPGQPATFTGKRLSGDGIHTLGDIADNLPARFQAQISAMTQNVSKKTIVNAVDNAGSNEVLIRIGNVKALEAAFGVSLPDVLLAEKDGLRNRVKARFPGKEGEGFATLVDSMPNGDKALQAMLLTRKKGDDNLMMVLEDGEAIYYEIRHPDIAYALASMRQEARGPVMKFFNGTRKLFQAMTTYTLNFAGVGFTRDLIGSMILPERGRGTKVVRGVKATITADKDFRRGDRYGGSGAGVALTEQASLRVNPKHVKARLLATSNPSLAKVGHLAHQLIRGYTERVIGTMERGQREGMRLRLIEAGYHPQLAAAQARQAYGNFAARGGNTAINNFLDVIPYARAGIIGTGFYVRRAVGALNMSGLPKAQSRAKDVGYLWMKAGMVASVALASDLIYQDHILEQDRTMLDRSNQLTQWHFRNPLTLHKKLPPNLTREQAIRGKWYITFTTPSAHDIGPWIGALKTQMFRAITGAPQEESFWREWAIGLIPVNTRGGGGPEAVLDLVSGKDRFGNSIVPKREQDNRGNYVPDYKQTGDTELATAFQRKFGAAPGHIRNTEHIILKGLGSFPAGVFLTADWAFRNLTDTGADEAQRMNYVLFRDQRRIRYYDQAELGEIRDRNAFLKKISSPRALELDVLSGKDKQAIKLIKENVYIDIATEPLATLALLDTKLTEWEENQRGTFRIDQKEYSDYRSTLLSAREQLIKGLVRLRDNYVKALKGDKKALAEIYLLDSLDENLEN